MTQLPRHDEWLARTVEMYRHPEVETRVRAKAAQLARHNERRRRAGAQIPVLQVDDFINHVWTIILKRRPEFPDREVMKHYFWRRLENHFKDQCVKPEKAKVRGVSMDQDASENLGGNEVNLISIDNYRTDEAQRAREAVLRDFRAYLAIHEAELLPLLNLILEHQVVNARDQAEKLKLPVKEIYRLRSRLQLQASRFNKHPNKS